MSGVVALFELSSSVAVIEARGQGTQYVNCRNYWKLNILKDHMNINSNITNSY